MMEHAKHAQSKKKTENISWGNVRRGVGRDGKPLGRRSCPTRNLSRRILRISSPSCGGLAGFRPPTVHSRRGNSTTTTTTTTTIFGFCLVKIFHSCPTKSVTLLQIYYVSQQLVRVGVEFKCPPDTRSFRRRSSQPIT